jgi:hypothetical protein
VKIHISDHAVRRVKLRIPEAHDIPIADIKQKIRTVFKEAKFPENQDVYKVIRRFRVCSGAVRRKMEFVFTKDGDKIVLKTVMHASTQIKNMWHKSMRAKPMFQNPTKRNKRK